MINWAKAQPISLKPKAGEVFGFAYDDPKTTSSEEFRFDLALTVLSQCKLQGEIIEKNYQKDDMQL